jgi:hypothetical protein
MASSSHPRSTSKCFFLDSLPLELRLHVYSYLVIASSPLQGKKARQQCITGLDLSVLRTNRRVYEEAKALFLGKNVFCISSVEDGRPTNKHTGLDGKGEWFEPPLTQNELKAVRHLEVDPVFRAREMGENIGKVEGWRLADEGAAEYSMFSPYSHPLRK